MSEQIKVRLYAVCTLRVPLDTEIDRDEFREWYEESGAIFDPDDVDTDAVVEFIKASPDDEYEMNSQFPVASATTHEVQEFVIEEAELLPTDEEATR